MSEQPVEPTSAPTHSPDPLPANVPTPEPGAPSSALAPVVGTTAVVTGHYTTPTGNVSSTVNPTILPGGEPDPTTASEPSGTTPTPVAVLVPETPKVPVGAVTPRGDVMRRRTDDDVLYGEFAKVIAGPYEGKTVSVQSTVETGADGYPTRMLVKTRDDRDELVVVNYKDLRPVAQGGR